MSLSTVVDQAKSLACQKPWHKAYLVASLLLYTAALFGNMQQLIFKSQLTSPLGTMIICASHRGICLLAFADLPTLAQELSDLQTLLNATVIEGENEHIHAAKAQLAEYFAGKRKAFDVALDTPSTAFRQNVWQELLKLPFGKTCSYAVLAKALGKSTAVRAVGTANGHNRVAIIIPCHRVIGADGSLTGYAGGLDRKRWLLELEGVINRQAPLLFD